MTRINEHFFVLNGDQYHLSFFEKPILLKNGLSQKVKPILKKYIEKENLPIQLVNKNGNEEVPWTLARKILEYFTEDSAKESMNSELIPKKKESVESKQNKQIRNVLKELKLSEKFKVVMICAGLKKTDSELNLNGHIIHFRAQSNIALNEFLPDDLISDKLTTTSIKKTWRDYICENQDSKNIPFKTYQLYNPNKPYKDLYEKLEKKYETSFFILSAGWGLVRANFRLPKYDITFSKDSKVDIIKKRKFNQPQYKDFNQLEDIDDKEDIIFIGGESYWKLFYDLTQKLPNRKIIFYNSINEPKHHVGNYIYIKFTPKKEKTRTNWHYELANEIANVILP